MTLSLSRTVVLALLLFLTAMGMAVTAVAQDAPAGDERSEAYSRLADILEDEQARERLIGDLRAHAQPAAEGAGAESATEPGEGEAVSLPRRVADFSQGIAEGLVSEFREAAAVLGRLDATDAAAGLAAIGPIALELAVVVLVTLAAFFLIRRLARRLFAWASQWALASGREGFGVLRRAAAVIAAAAVDLVIIILAWVIGYALALFVLGDAGEMDTRQALFLNAFLLIEVFKALIRIVFAARDEGLRLLPMAGEEAAYWNLWLARLAGFIGYGLMVVVPIINTDVAPELGRIVAVLIMAVAFICALTIILKNRVRVRENLEARAREAAGGFTGTLLQSLGRVWHIIAAAYFAALSLSTLVRPEDALPFMAQATVQTLVALGGGLFVSAMLTQIISRRIRVPDKTRQRFPLLEQRLNAFVPTGLKIVRAIILVMVLALLLDAWAVFDLGGWLVSEVGATVLTKAITVAVILAAAAAVWLAVASWIEQRLNPATGMGEPGSRERTLLAIFRNAVAVVLVTMAVMIALSEVGINIGPLIAGAGVLGLAVGFGAQKLVQDVITGVFIQLESAIDTGDVVTAGGMTGTVEKLTIRSLGMRDLAGTYHMLPFSSVDIVSNYMRDYGYHVGDYGVGYREDTDEVIARLRDAFDELSAHPEHGRLIVGELEVFGVTALGASSVNVRVRIKTMPGSQWAVGREYNRLVKRHLQASGIEIPYPHMTLYFGEDKDGTAPPARVRMLERRNRHATGETEADVDPERARANPKWKQDFDED